MNLTCTLLVIVYNLLCVTRLNLFWHNASYLGCHGLTPTYFLFCLGNWLKLNHIIPPSMTLASSLVLSLFIWDHSQRLLLHWIKNPLWICRTFVKTICTPHIIVHMSLSPRWTFLKWQPCHFPGMSCCYKLIQLFRVTCFIACKYNTALSWHITDFI